MLGKFHKNTKLFNILFSSLTFGLIALMLITSFYILITTMLFKNNYFNKASSTLIDATITPELYFNYWDMSVTVLGIVLFVLVGLSFVSLVAYSICWYLFAPICLKKWPIIWTLGFLSFSIFVMFILTMLGHGWKTKHGPLHVIVQSFLLETKDGVQYGGASITVLLFDIVIYCCLIISITKIILDFIKLSKKDFVIQEENINI